MNLLLLKNGVVFDPGLAILLTSITLHDPAPIVLLAHQAEGMWPAGVDVDS